MWFRPNVIPGKSIGTRQLPIDQHCDKCHLEYNEVDQKKEETTGEVTYHCPHCDSKVELPKEKKAISRKFSASKYKQPSRNKARSFWRF